MFGKMMVSALALTGAAYAQETVTPAPEPASMGAVSYPPDFFAQFSPNTALDMVRRVPGFTLDEGEDRRGFSGAAGNVLIDGRRPSAKNQSLDSILTRIPATQVARIELIRDASSTADAAGQATLINIVRTPSAGGGVWQGTIEQSENGRVSPLGNASWTGRRGQLDYSIGALRHLEYLPLAGRRFYSDGAGTVHTVREDTTPRTFRRAEINGELTFPLFDGSLRLNAQIDRFDFRPVIDQSDATPDGDPVRHAIDLADERQQNEEVGFNFDRAFGDLSVELIALTSRGHYANDESTRIFDGGAFASVFAQSRRNEFAETIGRATLSYPLADTLRLDFGGEVAANSLDAKLSLTIDENGSGPIPVDLPAANVLVEEQRAEAFATMAWRASDRWSVEGSLAQEFSTLTQTGDTDLETELTFLKPSIQITRQIGDDNQVRLRIYRDVGQLNFTDFVSAAALVDDIVRGGNPNLRPETSWRSEIAGDWRFAANGAIGARVFNYWLSDATDVVPVGEPGARFDAPGNIGDGWVRGLQLTATLPLDAILPRAQLTIDNTWQDSEVTDPVTGRPRIISGFVETTLDMRLRQDFPERDLAWGMEYFKQGQNTTFRINETDVYEEGPFLLIYAESTAFFGARARVFVRHATDSPFTRRREFYAGDRSGPLVLIEDRRTTRHYGSFWGITLSGSF